MVPFFVLVMFHPIYCFVKFSLMVIFYYTVRNGIMLRRLGGFVWGPSKRKAMVVKLSFFGLKDNKDNNFSGCVF